MKIWWFGGLIWNHNNSSELFHPSIRHTSYIIICISEHCYVVFVSVCAFVSEAPHHTHHFSVMVRLACSIAGIWINDESWGWNMKATNELLQRFSAICTHAHSHAWRTHAHIQTFTIQAEDLAKNIQHTRTLVAMSNIIWEALHHNGSCSSIWSHITMIYLCVCKFFYIHRLFAIPTAQRFECVRCAPHHNLSSIFSFVFMFIGP